MELKTDVKDLRKIVLALIVLVLVFGAYTIYKDVRHEASLSIFEVKDILSIHDQNFQFVKRDLDSLEGKIQRLELAAQISGNIVESGKLDAQGNPVKK